MKIITKDAEGRTNGYLIPIWNALEQPDMRPDQVYVTAIAPHCRKGPHLHKKRRGRFAVISGAVICWIRGKDGKYRRGDGSNIIEIAPGEAAALYNVGHDDALVINMPSPAWSKANPDDHPVNEWVDPEEWAVVTRSVPSCFLCKHPATEHDSGGCCRVNFCACQNFRGSE